MEGSQMSPMTANEDDDFAVADQQKDPAKRTIVVGYDGSEQAKAALAVAIDLATCGVSGKVVIACGQNRPPAWSAYTYRGPIIEQEAFLEDLDSQIMRDLEDAAATVRAAGVEAVTACSREHPVDTLLNVARDTSAKMIVIGATGAGSLHDVVMGSTTMRLLHRSELPVLVVPATK
jgi:nucleotide-binding universal stress UspA family protein